MSQSVQRPSRLAEFIGKKDLKSSLRVYLDAAISAQRSLDHCLFYGPAGTGKTTLAMVIAAEMGGKLKIVQGPNLQKPADIVTLLSAISKGDVLFIDEIHSMSVPCAELLYSAMEDGLLDIVIGKEFSAKPIRIKIAPFTVVGATTLLGGIPDALESRFGIVYKLDLYSEDEMKQIVNSAAKQLGVTMDEQQTQIVVANARGVPRNANRLVKRIADYVSQGRSDLLAVLQELNADPTGISRTDLLYLRTLHQAEGGLIGLKALSQSLDEDMRSIEQKIEPFLIKRGYVSRTAKGRRLTEAGKRALKEHENGRITPH